MTHKLMLSMALASALAGTALAQTTSHTTSTGTNLSTSVSTVQNSGVSLGTGAFVAGGIKTGLNISKTGIMSGVSNTSNTVQKGSSGFFSGGGSSMNTTSSTTNIGASQGTSQYSGVSVGNNAFIVGGIKTGKNLNKTAIQTDVSNLSNTKQKNKSGLFNFGNSSNTNTTAATTNVGTGMSTVQNSGVTLGNGAVVLGDVKTGKNVNKTVIKTKIVNKGDTTQVGNSGLFNFGNSTNTNITTANTAVGAILNTVQNSGVTLGNGAVVLGDVKTGKNVNKTVIKTKVVNKTDTKQKKNSNSI